jgi:hypothetical protein
MPFAARVQVHELPLRWKTVLNLLFWNVLDRSPTGQTEGGDDEKRAAGALERVLVADCYGQVNNFRMAWGAYKESSMVFTPRHFSSYVWLPFFAPSSTGL